MCASLGFGDSQIMWQPYYAGGAFDDWEDPVLPLNYTRQMVGAPGLYWGSQQGVTI